jgi:hypothetical protein
MGKVTSALQEEIARHSAEIAAENRRHKRYMVESLKAEMTHHIYEIEAENKRHKSQIAEFDFSEE